MAGDFSKLPQGTALPLFDHGVGQASSRQASTATATRPVTALAICPSCQYPRMQRCLYMDGHWWDVCPSCGLVYYEERKRQPLVQRHLFNIEAGDFDL